MKRAHIVAGVAAVALIGFTYVSPYISMYRISRAAKARDIPALAQHVDFPALRENLKQQLMASMKEKMASAGIGGNWLAAAGQTLGAKLLEPMIDTMVSPDGLAVFIDNGAHPTSDNGQPRQTKGKPQSFTLSYRSLNQVLVRREGSEQHAGEFTLQRSGLWSWKLTSIGLPDNLLPDSE